MNTLTTTRDLAARAAWSIITEPGDLTAGNFTQVLGHHAALALATTGRDTLIASLIKFGASEEDAHTAATRWIPRTRTLNVDQVLDDAHRKGITLIDPDTIPGLSDLGNAAPHIIWARGDVATLTRPLTDRIGLIGARAATAYGENIAAEFATDLTTRDITIVAGAAYGIDGAAHRGALAAGGSTIAWQASGIDRPYPMGHQNLIERIASAPRSVIASEIAPGGTPNRFRFIARNRLIAASTAATVVVEAGNRSGSLTTAGHATTLGRTLGAVPGPITSAASAGCHRLIAEYDAQIVTSAHDAYELLGR